MDHIQRKSKAARRRMIVSQFLQLAPYWLTAMLGIAVVGMLLPKIIYLPVPAEIWFASWLVSAGVLGLLVSLTLTWLNRPSLAQAAAEIDGRFALRERISSALLLDSQVGTSQLGSALIADAQAYAERIDIPDHFPWGMNRRLLLPLLPLLLSLLYFGLSDQAPTVAQTDTNLLTATQVKNSTQPLLDQVRRQLQEAEQQDLKDATELYKRLEQQLEKMRTQEKLDSKQALSALNDIKEQLSQRRQELGSSQALKKNLQNLDKLESGPAGKLTEALKAGDLEKAASAANELQQKLDAGELDAKQLEQLQQQLDQLERSLRQAVEAHEQAKRNLQDQIRQAKETNDLQRAGELQRKLDQLQSMDQSMSRLQELANQCKACKQCAGNSDQAALSQALSDLATKLGEMSTDDLQKRSIDDMLNQLSQCRSGMCQGQGQGQGQPTNTDSLADSNREAQASGARGEQEADVDFFDSQVQAQMQLGQTIYSGQVGGENRKGVSRVEVRQEIARELASQSEPLDESPLPRSQRDHTRSYFNAIREGH